MAAAASLGGAFSATAADEAFTGLYLGASVGYTRSNATVTPLTAGANSFTVSPKGPDGSAFVGYAHQFGGFVVGIEGEYDLDNVADDTTIVVGGSNTQTKLSLSGGERIRARLGYAFDKLLAYVSGGWTEVNAKLSVESQNAPGQAANSTTHVKGWNAGAGAEYAFTPNLLGRVEYIYDRFDDTTFGTSTSNPFFVDRKVSSFDAHSVRIAASYKF